MLQRLLPPRVGLRRLATLGAVMALLVVWVTVPALGGDRIVAAVAPGSSEPLPVASGFAAETSADAAPDDPAGGMTASSGAGDMPPTESVGPGQSASASSSAPASPPATAQPPAADAGSTATASIPRQGPGTYQLAAGGTEVVGTGDALVTYSVEVESGLPFDLTAVATRVEEILGDSRSWIGLGRWQLQRVEVGADARIIVASPGTVDNLCYPLQTASRYSCRNGPFVVLNADRWAVGADSWGADVEGYRGYLVNHEFGHFLGLAHTPCPGAGSPAPVMLQQTKGLDGCSANAWPTVTGG